ncbi:PadR family transcriptional regulator [Clostridium vincentii]|uniref:Transcriptional regulator PadR-like family protein n=1 Tax=Clostridium vincentii TaxID=52704 RepID=A0A2T0BHH8_9CLOT|nr:PadR family transcriptional regulator [Clostridium vincentii]PRR83303.1 Transcriptional regulator PadR-like family protein [Clostridium vincentii]
MDNFEQMNLNDIRSEEKRLYEEYKKNILQLKKVEKEKEAVGQVFTKGLLPIYVLYILNLNPANGNDICNKIGERTQGLWIPSTGGIYPLLKKFEKQGLVIGEWDDPKKKFQKIYKITTEGKTNFENKTNLLKPKIEEALTVFKIIYNDIY